MLLVEPAVAQLPSQQIIDTQQQLSQTFDVAVSEAMKNFITTPIFSEASNIGAIFALIGAFPVVMAVVRLYHADMAIDKDSFIHKGIVFIIIILLLGTPTSRGRLLGSTLVGTNSIVNSMSDKVLTAAAGENGVSAIAKEIVKSNAESLTDTGLEECSKIPEQGERNACLDDLRETVTTTLDPYVDEQWARQTSVLLQGQIVDASNGTLEYGGGNYVAEFLNSGTRVGQEGIKGICWAMGQAFIVGVEHIKILMVIIAPIFLGLHMVPMFQGFFTTWLKNFLMLELAHLAFNLIISLVAITMLTTTGVSGLVFPCVVACLSIVFSLLLVGGGGISMYSSAISATAGGISLMNNLRK